jgi:GT2 family glycosyltransferase
MISDTLSWQDIVPKPVLENISVVIPTLGRDLLEGCLFSIAAGSAWPKKLIVIDQSSSPIVASWITDLRECGIQAYYSPSTKKGVAVGINEGIRKVNSRFIGVTHDDCLVDDNWLVNLCTYLNNNPDEIVTGRVEPGGTGTVVSIKTSKYPEKYSQPQLKEDILFPNNMGFAMEIFSEVGYFDESEFLRYAEDNDWSYRALRLGITIAYIPEIVVTHKDWRDQDQLTATFRNYAFSQGGFYGKHLRKGDWFIVLRIVIGIIRSVKRLLIGALTNNHELRSNGLAVLFNLMPGIKAGFTGSKENA